MGSPEADKGANSDEKPQHRVRISRPFYLGKFLVTQEQWQTVMGSNPVKVEYKDEVEAKLYGEKNPVVGVSWEDCQGLFEKLNRKCGAGRGKFQLPTEAQWEYACRAGSATRYCFGDDESRLGEYASYDQGAASSGSSSGKPIEKFEWHEGGSRYDCRVSVPAATGGSSIMRIGADGQRCAIWRPVGQKKPNAWGAYDMHGNVWEWCQDWHDNDYGKLPTDDPVGPSGGRSRIARGGSWYDPAGSCRSAARGQFEPGARSLTLGIRASLVPADN
jgi:formylglycine-generating enzyme required for sulfatase activity